MIKILSGHLCQSKLLVLALKIWPPFIPSFDRLQNSLTQNYYLIYNIIRNINFYPSKIHQSLRKPQPGYLWINPLFLLGIQDLDHLNFLFAPRQPLPRLDYRTQYHYRLSLCQASLNYPLYHLSLESLAIEFSLASNNEICLI